MKKICNVCKISFDHGRSDKKICSKKCLMISRKVRRRKNKTLTSDGSLEIECKYCKNPCIVRTPNKQFCSLKCRSKYQKSTLYNLSALEHKKLTINESCDICGTKKTHQLCIDHCHETNKVRGYLCSKCNTGLGYFDDSIEKLKRASTYLLKSKTPQQEISEIMTKAYNRGWISSRDGNASVIKDGKFYITPSGILKYNISPADILVGTWLDSKEPKFETNIKPSGEYLMHVGLYSLNGVTAVLHLHPTYTIAALHRGFNLQDFEKEFAEINRFMKVGYNVPNVPPISKELADATKSSLIDGNIRYDIVGQVAHGVCATGKTLQECFEHVERLEHICQIVLASGVSPK